MEGRKEAWLGNSQIYLDIVIIRGIVDIGLVVGNYCYADVVRI